MWTRASLLMGAVARALGEFAVAEDLTGTDQSTLTTWIITDWDKWAYDFSEGLWGSSKWQSEVASVCRVACDIYFGPLDLDYNGLRLVETAKSCRP